VEGDLCSLGPLLPKRCDFSGNADYKDVRRGKDGESSRSGIHSRPHEKKLSHKKDFLCHHLSMPGHAFVAFVLLLTPVLPDVSGQCGAGRFDVVPHGAAA